MNLEELRESIASDAQKRCAAQEATIKRLHAEVDTLRERVHHLSKRCYVNTRGGICAFCKYEKDCPAINREGDGA